MSEHMVQLGFANLSVPPGSHIVYPFKDEALRKGIVASYVAAGVRSGEKCVVAIPEYAPDFWKEAISGSEAGPTPLSSGQVSVLSPSLLFSGSSGMSAQRASEAIASTVRAALDSGWDTVRVCTGFDYLLDRKRVFSELIAAESKIEQLLVGSAVTLMCTLDSAQHDPAITDAYLHLHPLVTDGLFLKSNPLREYGEDVTGKIADMVEGLEDDSELFAALDFAGDTPIIRAGEELDLYTSPAAESLARRLIDHGYSSLIVDLSRTSFMDAGSISMILRILQLVDDRQGSLAIVDPRGDSRKIFRLVEFNRYVTILGTLQDAEQVTSTVRR